MNNWYRDRDRLPMDPQFINGNGRFPHVNVISNVGINHSAISPLMPTPLDIQNTKDLADTLRSYGIFESDQELLHRIDILNKLNTLLKSWVITLSEKKGMPEHVAEQAGGKIFTFGSYRLGVHNKGADIDALCVVPRHIERSDYFTSFVEYLREQPEVSELRAVEEAFVPVIKMTFEGVDIDLLVSRLALNQIPDDLELTDDGLLKNLDDKSVKSLNGCRVTDEILRLVPNVESFRLSLRAIKLWAKNHGIYSNILGFLGGVSWAMLVARTCQLTSPNASAATIVQKFFDIFYDWPWPIPVVLKPQTSQEQNTQNTCFPCWDPAVNLADRYHLMPIITPAYPQQNSTYNVSSSTFKIMTDEFKEVKYAHQIENICAGKATWDHFFQSPPFFSRYSHFIRLLAHSSTTEDLVEWYGLIESKIRHLVGQLEKNRFIELPRVWPKSFPLLHPIPGRESTQVFIGLQLRHSRHSDNGAVPGIDLTSDLRYFRNSVIQAAEKLGVSKEGNEFDADYVRKRDLSQYLSEEILGPRR